MINTVTASDGISRVRINVKVDLVRYHGGVRVSGIARINIYNCIKIIALGHLHKSAIKTLIDSGYSYIYILLNCDTCLYRVYIK